MYKVNLIIDTAQTQLGLNLAEFLDRPLREVLEQLVVSGGAGGETAEEWIEALSITLAPDDLSKWLKHMREADVTIHQMADDWDYADKFVTALLAYAEGWE